MHVPQKWQYALRAVFELARRGGRHPVKVSDIAEAQGIPPRFLEVILHQLKRAGIVDSRRGNEGGYLLARSAGSLCVGDVMRCIEGEIEPLRCESATGPESCRLYGECVFLPMWQEAWKAMWDVYDGVSFQKLVDDSKRKDEAYVPSYCI